MVVDRIGSLHVVTHVTTVSENYELFSSLVFNLNHVSPIGSVVLRVVDVVEVLAKVIGEVRHVLVVCFSYPVSFFRPSISESC